MSGEATGWVMRHGPSRTNRAAHAVLLTIADAANRDGSNSFPGIDAMVQGSSYGRSSVFTALRWLLDEGWIEELAPADSKPARGRGHLVTYRIPGVRDRTWTPGRKVQGSDVSAEAQAEEPSGTGPGKVQEMSTVLDSSPHIGNENENGNGKAAPASPPRSWPPAARKIAEHLATKRRENGCAPQQVTDAWFDAARLLVEKDGRGEQEVHAVIEWVSRHKRFWAGRIKTPRHLREHYDEIRLQMESDKRTSAATGTISPHILAYAGQVAAEEGEAEMTANGQGVFA